MRLPARAQRRKTPISLRHSKNLANPTLSRLLKSTKSPARILGNFLQEPKNRTAISYRFDSCGYVKVTNPDQKGGRWFVAGQNQTIYGKKTITLETATAVSRITHAERITAARKLAQEIPTNASRNLGGNEKGGEMKPRNAGEMGGSPSGAHGAWNGQCNSNEASQSVPKLSSWKRIQRFGGKIFQGKY